MAESFVLFINYFYVKYLSPVFPLPQGNWLRATNSVLQIAQ